MGIGIHKNQSITRAKFQEFTDQYDVIVDATGQLSLTNKALGTTGGYSGYLVALNADVKGDFTDLYPNSRIVLENYTGYAWAFSKTPNQANVGIGRTSSERPDDYMAVFEGVIESVTHEDAGSGNCVYELPNPARRGFSPRVLQSRGYRDARAVRTS